LTVDTTKIFLPPKVNPNAMADGAKKVAEMRSKSTIMKTAPFKSSTESVKATEKPSMSSQPTGAHIEVQKSSTTSTVLNDSK
jgi:hypothetical protein